MAKKSALHVVLENHRPKMEAARRRAGPWRAYEYRVKTDEPIFAMSALGCTMCYTHDNPAQDSIGWVTPKKPLEIGQQWVRAHGVPATVQRRRVIAIRELGKKAIPQGTWIRRVEAIPGESWRDWKSLDSW